MKLGLEESDLTVHIQLIMKRMCTFGNDLKKRDRVHILKCEIFQFEDWKRGLVSLVEKFFVK